MAIDLREAVVCITGGARGIGRATAQTLARQGATVWIGDLDAETVEATAAELGNRVRGHVLDVTNPDSFADFLAAAAADRPLDVLVNNAGIWRVGDFLDQPLEGIEREIAVNLSGVVNGMRLALPGMVARGRGHVINVSSMAGKMSLPGGAIYSATKFGVAALSRAVRAELPTRNVAISTVYPATVATDLQTGIALDGVTVFQPEDVAEAILRCIREGKRDVAVPQRHSVFGVIEVIAPQRLFDRLKRKMTVGTLKTIDHEKRGAYYAAMRAGR